MRRLQFTLTVVSLACGELLLGLWGWSDRWAYSTGYSEPAPAGVWGVTIAVVRGKLLVIWGTFNGVPVRWTFVAYPHPDGYDLVGAGPMDQLCGLELSPSSAGISRTLWFPVAFPAVIAAIPPALWLRRRRKQGGTGFPVEVTSEAA